MQRYISFQTDINGFDLIDVYTVTLFDLRKFTPFKRVSLYCLNALGCKYPLFYAELAFTC